MSYVLTEPLERVVWWLPAYLIAPPNPVAPHAISGIQPSGDQYQFFLTEPMELGLEVVTASPWSEREEPPD